ncbi:SHOCT domain-containing protein [Streptomyces acidicola]|uniref:SHOCT domain-containing protein n=1 Tax=Streptomyces acidicola TaxID=2596892 RepID=UPI00381486A3
MSAQTYLAYDFPLLGAFWAILWFFLWILWFVLLFRIVLDIFRDDGLSGWAKAGWLVFVVVLPFLGVFVYVVARGRNMGRREMAQARAQQEAFDSYIRETAGSKGAPSSVDELTRLSEIRARGDITDEEFRRAKELVLAGHGPAERPGAGGSTSTSPSTSGH